MKNIHRLASRDWIGLTIVLVGFGLRLRQYLVNRSLWLDEAMLTNNILARDFAGLFHPLDNDQGAPVGFLLVQKLVTLALGDSEYALRLVPFLAGVLALALMFLLARKISNAFAGNLALALFAISPALIYYASEVKQYSSDVAIALALILLFLKTHTVTASPKGEAASLPDQGLLRATSFDYASLRSGSRPRNDEAIFAFLGALVIWFSHPALFVIAALGLTLFAQAVREKDKRQIAALLLVALAWALSLAALYFVNLRQLSTHQFFLDYWRAGFVPRDASAFAWLVNSLRTPFADLLGLQLPYLVSGLLFLLGMIGLTRRLPRFGLFLLLIFFLALFASFLTFYPFAGRMILFLVPIFCLFLAEGVDFLPDLTGSWKPVRSLVFLALSAALLFSPLSLAYENVTAPKMREHIRPTMETLRENLRDGDAVYVYYWAEHAVRFYAPKYEMDISTFLIGADHHDQPTLYRLELDALRGRGRVWFLFSHIYEEGGFNERDYILDYLNSIGELKREYRQPGTSVFLYLYDLK
ncbi:MAG: glycosyltransferase family 39 protein [Chloroflexi bacterium]|nr:glycosyltransferase family 39 protein [Chloroflexota bacterium]